jgi:hypothetical protein
MMSNQNLIKAAACLVAPLLILAAIGCSKAYQIAEVDGTLTIAGKPANKIHVQFVPISQDGTKLPISNADTDSRGKFSLELHDGNDTVSGSVVGTSRVALSDMQFAESNGRGVKLRLRPEYTLPGSTPFRQVITEGKQTIEIKVP